MSRRDDYLFADGELSEVLESIKGGISRLVGEIPKDQLLSNSIEDLVAYVSDKLIVSPLKLYEESKTMEHQEIQVDVSRYPNRNIFGDPGPIYVPGVRVTISIPYSGTTDLWHFRPNHWQSVVPHGRVMPLNSKGIGQLDIVIEQPNDEDPERIKAALKSELESLRFYLSAQDRQIKEHNDIMPGLVKKQVEARRDRIKKQDKLTDLLEIPLKTDGKAPSITPLEIRQIVQPLSSPPKSGYKPEPGITLEIYEHILSIIRHEGRTFETTPKTYSVHDEEELRNILLAHLNGHFKGTASGETFRRSGKTDIKIEAESRAAFVAECKIWGGPKELLEAVDQLLGYLTWRDCKAALIVFNKHVKGFSEVLAQVPEVLKTHTRIKKSIGTISDGEWDFVFMSKEDDGRLVHVRVFLFNIFSQ
ncbi:hypothetical protein BU251_02425 [Candidatus Velamenicoccus archaeovorus]|uniref:Uncharacterized protein n=1 Tax=Velamenicoccus archaeovorus TaxID=1930593 RepID=A0A410P3T8_VELA1|nr:hypothetical protein [Candidatus Velamenicoccus archaeovorus]QAT16664.1 hypothetical protein BU251_02425 [Candidatus Velamenicoccus archaeovorus]